MARQKVIEAMFPRGPRAAQIMQHEGNWGNLLAIARGASDDPAIKSLLLAALDRCAQGETERLRVIAGLFRPHEEH